jgi:hypothetical protein
LAINFPSNYEVSAVSKKAEIVNLLYGANAYQLRDVVLNIVSEITEYAIGNPISFPESITDDRADNIWFTESGVNKIGRMAINRHQAR